MRLDELLGKRQAEPKRRLPADAGFGDPVEAIENARYMFRRYADTRVAHAHHRASIARFQPHFDGPTLGSVFDRIVQEVVEHLAQPACVSGYVHFAIPRNLQAEVLCDGQWSHGLSDSLDQCAEVYFFQENVLGGILPGQAQELVGEARQSLTFFQNTAE